MAVIDPTRIDSDMNSPHENLLISTGPSRIVAAVVTALLLPCVPSLADDPVITEFLAANSSSLRDSDGDTSDWIEIHNPGAESVELGGWRLTDDSLLLKWAFPDLELPADARLVVFASGKDRTDTGDGGAVVDSGRDSSTFAHRLEFDDDGVLPSVEGGDDGWREDAAWNVGGPPPSLDVADGLLAFESVLSGQQAITMPGGSAWEAGIDAGTSYTFEVRLRVVSSGGANPGAIIWLANGEERLILRVEENGVSTWSGIDLDPDGRDNATELVAFRVAYDATDGLYTVWRDGVLLGDDVPSDGAASGGRTAVYLIDCCSSVQVAGELDWVRWDATGAYPPPGAGGGVDLPELHTNFSLSSSGEYLALVSPDGTRVSTEFAPSFPLQRRDVSYGPDGYYLTPTPGAPNGTAVAGFTADPEFSRARGFYDASFDLALSTATPGASIRYTVDGSKPSADDGLLYSGPIEVTTTTCVRAIAFAEGFASSKAITHSYLFLEDVLRQTGAGFPVDPDWDYDMDPNVVDDPRYADGMIGALRSLPTLSLALPVEDMFGPSGIHANPTQGGFAWERETSAEWILPDGTTAFQVDCGVRIQGAGSRFRSLGKKSFRLAFRSRYGPGKLEYPIFGFDAADEFDTLVVRGNYFDTWSVHTSGDGETIGWEAALLFRDPFGYISQADSGHTTLHGTWVHLYIDGLYWGVYNVTERPDEEFAASYFGGDPEDYDVLKQRPRGAGNGSPPDLVSGDRAGWNELRDLVLDDIASSEVYAEVGERLDLGAFADYLILNLWGGNQDWPHNNWYAIRDAEDGTPFRFIAWDTENFIFRLNESGKLNTSVDHSPGILYSRLRTNEEFRVLFGDHAHRLLFHGGAFTPESASERFSAIADEIRDAMDGEAARWGDTRIEPPRNRLDTWEVVIADKLGRYFPRRTDIALGQFRSIGLYPDVDAPVYNRHGGAIDPGFALRVSAPAGTVWLTLDGSDPRLPGGSVSPSATEVGTEGAALLNAGAPARALVPTDGALGVEWTHLAFDDATWLSGATGVGFERSSGFEDLIGLDVETQAWNVNETVYVRVPFERDGDPAAVGLLTLRMQYDDGFVAYLNGTEIASRNAPDDLTWNSGATRGHTDSAATVFESIDVSEHVDALRRGTNVLAIHGLNSGVNSSDLLFVPEINAVRLGGVGLVLDRTTIARSRARAGDEWSALHEATFVVDSSVLRITEIMYHPRPAPVLPDDPPGGSPFSDDDFEFIELRNVGDVPINLVGMRFVSGIEFTFPAGSQDPADDLQPGEFVLVVENLEAFRSRYDVTDLYIAGQYRGNLDNDGESIVLVDALGRLTLDFVYSDNWHRITDGLGRSLEIIDATAPPETWGLRTSWSASEVDDGTPGTGPDLIDGGLQRPGDINQDGNVDISDGVGLLGHLFGGALPVLPCGDGTVRDAANRALLDGSGDGSVDLSDAVYLLNYLFQGGPPHAGGVECVSVSGCPRGCDS